MNSRPKDPKTARNKNVLMIGGSGSGKTRFWLKPNLMQMHSSYDRPKRHHPGGVRQNASARHTLGKDGKEISTARNL